MFARVKGPRLLAIAAALAALGAAGCGRGGSETADLANGKKMFVGEGKCGSCHALARAGTKGTQGPDLDEAFGPARRSGLGERTVEGVVKRQIDTPLRNSIMQPDLVTGDDARDVAAYVAFAAGKGGKDTGELAKAGAPKVSNKPIPAKNGTLTIDADPTGALAFVSTKASATAGALQFVMGNKSGVQHNIALKASGGSLIEEGPVVGEGGKSEFSASVKPGKYLFVCTVPGHEEGGMKGELTVK